MWVMGDFLYPHQIFAGTGENKLGLNWAKLSSNWDWTLLSFFVDLVSLDIVWQNLFGGFCFVDFIEKIWVGKFGSLNLKKLLGLFNFVDLVLKIGLG